MQVGESLAFRRAAAPLVVESRLSPFEVGPQSGQRELLGFVLVAQSGKPQFSFLQRFVAVGVILPLGAQRLKLLVEVRMPLVEPGLTRLELRPCRLIFRALRCELTRIGGELAPQLGKRLPLLVQATPFPFRLLTKLHELDSGRRKLLLGLRNIAELFPRGGQLLLFFVESRSGRLERGAIGFELRDLGRDCFTIRFELLAPCSKRFFVSSRLLAELLDFDLSSLFGFPARFLEVPP